MVIGRSFEMQPWTTLRGDATWSGVMEEFEEWVDTGDAGLGIVRVEAPFITGCTLYLEGCDDAGGSFTTQASFGAGQTGASLVYLYQEAPFGAASRKYRLLRWKVVSAGGNWEACFRLNVVLK